MGDSKTSKAPAATVRAVNAPDDSREQTRFFCCCGQRLRAFADDIGKQARCPRCGRTQTIPHHRPIDTAGSPILARMRSTDA